MPSPAVVVSGAVRKDAIASPMVIRGDVQTLNATMKQTNLKKLNTKTTNSRSLLKLMVHSGCVEGSARQCSMLTGSLLPLRMLRLHNCQSEAAEINLLISLVAPDAEVSVSLHIQASFWLHA